MRLGHWSSRFRSLLGYDSLVRGSLFLMVTFFLNAIIGFAFWIVAAKLYSKSDIGVATTVISIASLPMVLSKLGLDQSLVRFFPDGDKNAVFSTVIIVTSLLAVVVGFASIALILILIPRLSAVHNLALIFVAFILATSVTVTAGQALLAMRKPGLFFLQNLLLDSRLLLLAPFVFLGAVGIVFSWIIASFVAIVFSAMLLAKLRLILVRPSVKFLRESFRFSAGNYLTGILTAAPLQIMPALVFNVLGAEKAATYYLTYAIASLLFLIPSAFSISLFVEGSYGESIHRITRKAIIGSTLFLSPLVVLLVVFGRVLLGSISQTYEEAYPLLVVMAISSVFVAIGSVYFSVARVEKKMGTLVIAGLIICVMLLGLGYLLMLRYGIVGVGYAWLVGYAAASLLMATRFL
jgi:O-antigen/teichoic acid export membrane protein